MRKSVDSAGLGWPCQLLVLRSQYFLNSVPWSAVISTDVEDTITIDKYTVQLKQIDLTATDALAVL